MRITLGDHIVEINERTTTNNQHRVLTSSQKGIVSQDEYFNKQIASKENTGYKIVKRGQFTYRAMSDTGRFYINRLMEYDVGIVSPAYPVFEVIEDNIIYTPYIVLFFESDYFQSLIVNQSTGSTRVSLKLDKIKKISIDIPSYQEQKEIVEKIESAKRAIAARDEQLSCFNELVKSRFIELFGDPDTNPLGWNEDVLSEHLEVIGGYAFKSDKFEDEGIPVLRIGNINSGRFLPVNMVYWNDDPALERYKMYPGDLVMSLTGTVGKDDYGNVCILGADYPEYYLNQRNAKLSLKTTLNAKYLSELLKFERIKRRLTGISRGVRQANISNKDILCLCVPIAPINIQQQFASFVEQTDKSKLAVQKALEELEILKKSLMQQYFG